MVNIGIGGVGQPILATTIGLTTTGSWFVVGGMATLVVASQSLRNIARLGLRGSVRPRWWFEMARLFWIVFLFLALSTVIPYVLQLRGFANRIINPLWFGLHIAPPCFCIFFVVTSVGYGLSIVWRRPLRGRAFECVEFFYGIVGGISLIGLAVSYWPPRNVWPDGVVFYVGVFFGVLLLLFGFVSSIIRYEKSSERVNLSDSIKAR